MSKFEAIDFFEMLSFFVFGGSLCLFIQGIVQCFVVFQRRNTFIWNLSLLGLVAGISKSFAIVALQEFHLDSIIFFAIHTPSFFILIQATSWVCYKRIATLGGITKYDKYIKSVPFVILAIQIPCQITFVLEYLYQESAAFKNLFSICIVSLSIIITMCEVFMYKALLAKINEMLEYRKGLRVLLTNEIRLGLGALISLDCIIIYTRLAFPSSRIDSSIRSFSYILRIVFVIKFFGDLLAEITGKNNLRSSKSEIFNLGSFPNGR